MRDEALRAAERCAQIEDTTEARVSLIRARLRAGELTREKLALAAAAGDRESQLALGMTFNPCACVVAPCRGDCLSPVQLRTLLAKLERTADHMPAIRGVGERATGHGGIDRVPYVVRPGRYVMVLAAVSAGWAAWDGHRQAAAALDAAGDWLRCPCVKHEGPWHKWSAEMPASQDWVCLAAEVQDLHAHLLPYTVAAATAIAGHDPVREAVSRVVIRWALEGTT